VVQTVASGDASVGVIVFPTNVSQGKQAAPDAPIEFTYLDVLAVIPTVQAILAGAPHPNAAQLFSLYMMSRDGQTVNNQDKRASSVLGDLPGAVPAPPKSTVEQPTAEVAAQHQQDVINLFHQLY
jgi:iron(III) transport system substrate-binding protein